MATTMTSRHSAARGQRDLLRRRHSMVRVWTLHPFLDLCVAILLGVAAGGYTRDWAPPPEVLIRAIAVTSMLLGVGWGCCAVLVRWLRGTPVPGFARGFPAGSANALLHVVVQSVAIAAIAATFGLAGYAGWMALPWALLLSAAAATAAGLVRWIQMTAPLARIVLSSATGCFGKV